MKFYQAEEYQNACRLLFNDYRDKIRVLLPEVRVEHIGSSAIPDCISKGDLDIFVGVPADIFEESIILLSHNLSFHEKLDTLRTDSLCMLECDDKNQDIALQVVANNTEFECFLVFRDKLLNNPQLVVEYNKLKLACTGFEADDYRRRKNQFIKTVLSH